MTMRFSHLKTHWNADDAYAIITFLDELRDALWETYGVDIIEDKINTHIKKDGKPADQDRQQRGWLDENDSSDF